MILTESQHPMLVKVFSCKIIRVLDLDKQKGWGHQKNASLVLRHFCVDANASCVDSILL